jgi:hypothetical protein
MSSPSRCAVAIRATGASSADTNARNASPRSLDEVANPKPAPAAAASVTKITNLAINSASTRSSQPASLAR